MRTLLATFLTAWALLGVASAQPANTSPGLAPAPSVIQLGHGVNFGDMLEAPREGDWGATIQEDYFPTIRQAGFTVIRVPICWSAHVSPAPDYTIDPAFFSRVDWVVAQAEKNNLQAILDYHNDNALMDHPEANTDRFIATWKQIAGHYRNAPPSILFELLNEPNAKLNAPSWNLLTKSLSMASALLNKPTGKPDNPRWNDLLAKTLAAVRVTNPTRTIVVGPAWWNSIDALPQFILPDNDRHLLVTVHYYDPLSFTHQGASWVDGSDKWLGNTWQGADAEKLAVTQAFDQAAAWGAAHRRPIVLGEFGAYSKGDMDSRARWTAFVARTAESHGFPWTYWEFCAGFGVYDPQAHQWRQPLLNALMPK